MGHAVVMSVHVFLAVAIIALVLLQRGKGADAGAGFGAGASGTVFGARGSSTALSKATAILAALFFMTSLALAFLGGRARPTEPTSLLERAATQQQPAATSDVPAPADGTTKPAVPPAESAGEPAGTP
jgi:preprotein translocase subunit SecG